MQDKKEPYSNRPGSKFPHEEVGEYENQLFEKPEHIEKPEFMASIDKRYVDPSVEIGMSLKSAHLHLAEIQSKLESSTYMLDNLRSAHTNQEMLRFEFKRALLVLIRQVPDVGKRDRMEAVVESWFKSPSLLLSYLQDIAKKE